MKPTSSQTPTNALATLVEELEQDRSLHEPRQLRQRIDALDRLDALVSFAQAEADDSALLRATPLLAMAGSLRARLEALNVRLYRAIRRDIQRRRKPEWLLHQVDACSRPDGETRGPFGHGYDYLDEVMGGIFRFDEPSGDIADLAEEMVFYQPTPIRHVFDLIGRAALTERDVLVDLGSGLGHVALLVSICTGARCIGIEREAAYVDCARRCAAALNLSRVTFIEQDAREADFSSGTLFYLYTPFTGAILRSVLASLRHEARTRAIRICTHGPCTPVVAAEAWLEIDGAQRADRPTLFRSVELENR